MPRLLLLVSPDRRTPVTVTDQAVWTDTTCARCEKRLDTEPAVFLEAGEVRCRLCVGARVTATQCVWCGREASRVQDTGDRYCQPCWAIYVAYVADEVEDPSSPYRRLVADVRHIIEEDQRAAQAEAPAPAD